MTVHKVDISDKAEVKISYLDDFVSWFGGKTEELSMVTLPKRHHDLAKNTSDDEIFTDLGGKEAAEVTLAGIYELMKLQPNGEDGALLTNGNANIFYVRDVYGELRVVPMRWYGCGWGVLAFRVGVLLSWGAGSRVFSRNS